MAHNSHTLRDRLGLFWTSSKSPKPDLETDRAHYIADPLSTFVLVLISGAPLLAVMLISSVLEAKSLLWTAAVLISAYLLARLIEVLCFPVKVVPMNSVDTKPGWKTRIVALTLAIGVFALIVLIVLQFRR